MAALVMRHNIQSVMEHTDNRTVHSSRSFLLKIEDDIITVSVKKADLDSRIVYLKYYGQQCSKKKGDSGL